MNPDPLPSHRFLGTLTVLGEEALYCIAPDPEERDEPTRGLRVWRWLPWATSIPVLSRWREQNGERAHRVMATWAESLTTPQAVAIIEAPRRPWQPGDPEPPNAYPFHIHAAPCPSADPWATMCDRRVPRDALATHPAQVDCPACIERIEAGASFVEINMVLRKDEIERMREERARLYAMTAPVRGGAR